VKTIGKKDKAVIKAFTERRALDGHKLTTNGTKLDLVGLGGSDIAHWKGDKIHFPGHHGSRSGQLVERAIARAAAKNDLYNGRGYNPSSTALARRRNPARRKPNARMSVDKMAAIGLGVVGAGIGLVSTLAAQGVTKTWKRVLVGTIAGGGTGAVIGALVPKRVGNPATNPLGMLSAVAAGTVLALVPVAVAAKVALPKAAGRSMPPTVRAKMGEHAVEIYRNGPTWAWRAAELDMAGAGDTRRDAIINAYSELVVQNLTPADRVTLDFYPEQYQLQVLVTDTGGWTWSTIGGQGGDAQSRGDALIHALDWVDDNSEID
jgi:hypothetical protein